MTQKKLVSVLEQYPERFSYEDEHLPGLSPSAEELQLQLAQIEDIAFDLAPADRSLTMAKQRTAHNKSVSPEPTLFS